MPEYLSPGVYIEELNTGPVPIEGVSTSTAGFVGQTERGPTSVTLVTSFTEYQRTFGSFIDPSLSYLPFAVKGFFDNGGQRVFIARVTGAGSIAATLPLAGMNLTASAVGEGAWGNQIYIRIQASTLQKPVGFPAPVPPLPPVPVGFRLTLLYYATPPPTPFVDPLDKTPAVLRDPNRRVPDVVEDFDNLRVDPKSSDYVLTIINGSSQLISLALTAPGPVTLPGAFPAPPARAPFTPMAGGTDVAATDVDYIALATADMPPNERRGLQAIDSVDEISLVCVPDEERLPAVTVEIITQCERRKDRFAILQVPRGEGLVTQIFPPQDSSYAAYYSPWIRVYNDLTGENLLIPPGGHIAGIYADTDIERGVHKAPANCEIAGIVTRDIDSNTKPLEYTFTKGDQDILNPRGVNVIRDFRSHLRGIRVYGARTMSSDSRWKYINVRRLFIFVEQSVDRGTQWLVFEPNDDSTWAQVRRSLTDFLTSVWRSGALMGTTADEAFFVKCDRTTMTQDDIDNGRLICLVGIAPVKPAEFVIFRFSQKTIEAPQ